MAKCLARNGGYENQFLFLFGKSANLRSMQNTDTNNLYRELAKLILLAAGVVVLLWLLLKITSVVLLLLFAMVLAIIINAPVVWLENKGLKRGWASLVVFVAILGVLVLLGWLVVPKVTEQIESLVANLPGYINSVTKNLSSLTKDYPALSKDIDDEGLNISKLLPSLSSTLLRIGNFSVNILSGLVLLIIFISMIVYAVASPKPLLEIYYSWFRPEKRDIAKDALINTSNMLVGWLRFNLIGGAIEAVCTTAFLTFMHVPGAWVWGALTLFAELIPKIGFYIMALPPVLVSFSVGPSTALWVAIFFLVLSELVGDFVMPRLRASTMSIHPVSTIFMLLAMGSAFGLTGALLATPMAAIIKAYYEAFYSGKYHDNHLEQRIEEVLHR